MTTITLHPGEIGTASLDLNRKTFNRLVADNDDLFNYVRDRKTKNLALGYENGEFVAYSDYEATWDDQESFPQLKILIDAKFAVSIPFHLLRRPTRNNWLYRITFCPASDHASEILSHVSFAPFRNGKGYVGITSRENPFDRFREHRSKAENGSGHLLHKAWAEITKITDVIVQFTLVVDAESRAQIFELEEAFVDTIGTIAPHGLNVIPGGMKGIQELWKLGLLARHEKPTDHNLDRALTRLESERSPVTAHYRRGHIRHLSGHYKNRTTWVSPCWVGMGESANVN